ncbi:MAG: hypothetical protein EOP32_18670 [Rhodococcus sp. (in: high G+C Gram-positive bacteria)]|nr:MAG: hypothetical protein EOP32_18670 [Rhodococcus sp. (in: high G+C Gram-positive bacteria)]
MTTPTPNPKSTNAKTDAKSVGSQFVDAAKKAGNLSLDTYEKALESSLDFHTNLGDASSFEWIGTVTRAQATLVRDVSAAATSAARELLK